MPEELLEDASQLGYQAYQTRRLLERRLVLTKRRPSPPRGVTLQGNTLVWQPPQDALGITHYRIYADDDQNPIQVVPVGTLNASGFVGTKLYVSSFNINNGQESTKAVYDGTGSRAVGGVYRMTGDVDGTNAIFTAPYTPLMVIVDGLIQEPGADAYTGDYTQSGKTVTFNTPSIPRAGAKVLCM